MGKRHVVPKMSNPASREVSKQRPLNAALRSTIVTADEYCSSVIALVNRVEDVWDENEKMLDLSLALRRLLLSRYDSSLPLWWTFVAVEKSLWLDRKSKDPIGFGTAILDFVSRVLRSLKSLSAVNASGRTAVAAIAPVVGLLYDVASVLSHTVGPLGENESSSGTPDDNKKKARKLARNLKESVKELLSFTTLCHCKDSEAFERSFSPPSAPNVPLENFPDFLYPPFRLASKKGMAKSLSRDLFNSAVLAEVVSGEVVLLQLIVEIIDRRIRLKKQNTDFGAGQDEFVQKLKNLAVHSVWDGSYPSPSEMVLDVLLEKRLPILDLVDVEEETLVRGALFETVLIDVPLFSLFAEAGGESTSSNSGLDHSSVAYMKKLLVARRAVAFFRSREERSRLAALEIQMTTWNVPAQLLKWLKSKKKQRLPLVALRDQQALTTWLVKTAEKSVFSAILDEIVATRSLGLTSAGTDKHVEVLEVDKGESPPNGDGEDLFFVDAAGDTELAADLDFAAAAKSMTGESEKMKKKKKKKRSKVLFFGNEKSSNGAKISRMEMDDADATGCSGSDSEDSEENRSKSAKEKGKTTSGSDSEDSEMNRSQSAKEKGKTTSGSDSEDSEENRSKSAKKKGKSTSGSDSEDSEENRSKSAKKKGKTTSGSDSEDSEENRSKSAKKKGNKSKQKAVDVCAMNEEDKDYDSDGALASGDLASIEESSPESSGNLGNQQQEELHLSRTPKSPKDQSIDKDQAFGEVTRKGAAEEQIVKVPQQEVAVTLPDEEEAVVKETPLVPSEGTLSLGRPSRSRKGKEGQNFEVTVDLGTAEFPSQPLEETVNTSIRAIEVDTQDTLTVSQPEPVLLSVGKSAKKKKSKDPKDPDIEARGAGTEDLARQQEETGSLSVSMSKVDIQNTSTISQVEVLPSMGRSAHKKKKNPREPVDLVLDGGGAGTEELSSKAEETINTSVSCTEVDTQNMSTIDQLEPVLLSVGKSAKKKKSKDPKDPKDPDIEAGGAGTEDLARRPEETVSLSASITKVDIQITSTISQKEPVLPPMGKTSHKKKKNPKDHVDLVLDGGGAGTEELPSKAEETINTSVSGTEVDTQNMSTVSLPEPVLQSVGKSSKKKLKDSGDPDREAPADDLGRSKDASLLLSTPTTKLVNGDSEADTEGKGDAQESLVASTTFEVVEARVGVEGVHGKDFANQVTTNTCEDLGIERSSLRNSPLTAQKEGGEDLEQVGEPTATLSTLQEETLAVKSSKKKRRRENPRHADEDDHFKILDAIRQDLVAASTSISSAEIIDALQAGKSQQSGQQESMTSQSKRSRLGVEGDGKGDVQGTTTRETTAMVSVANSDDMKSGNELTWDGKVSQRDGALPEEQAISAAILTGKILGKGQAEDVIGCRPRELEPNKSTLSTQVNQPIDSVVSGAENETQGTARAVKHKSPFKKVVEQTEPQTQDTPASGTSAILEVKEEVCKAINVTPSRRKQQRGKDEDERKVKTPSVVVELSDTEPVPSVKPSARKRKVKPEMSQIVESETTDEDLSQPLQKRKVKPEISRSVESETTDEGLYQRRTRSGRTLGTPPPTPRSVNMRRKLVLEPLDEEK